MKLTLALLFAGSLGLIATVGARSERPNAQTTYFANGQVKSEVLFEDGRREGPARRWFADGTLQAEGEYAQGEAEGRWTWYRPDGSVDEARSGLYRAGVLVAGAGLASDSRR